MYKISNKKLNKEKRSPIWTLVYILFLGILVSIPDYGEEFDWSKLTFIVVITGIFSVGARTYGVMRYLKWANSHRVGIEHEGLSFQSLGTITTLPWDQVTSLKVKVKRENVVNVILKTQSSGKIEFKDYDNLKKLCEDLKAHVDKQLWK